jgi:rRNA pseudouridine-1189 N-methylase Emg1 (Nep1/Mra1 family)
MNNETIEMKNVMYKEINRVAVFLGCFPDGTLKNVNVQRKRREAP